MEKLTADQLKRIGYIEVDLYDMWLDICVFEHKGIPSKQYGNILDYLETITELMHKIEINDEE